VAEEASAAAAREGVGDMKPKDFLKQLQHDEIVAAIRDAEKKTSGEIRVFISHKKVAGPVETAQREFERLGMTKTRERNGVLIFVAPRSRSFAVIGDEAVHRKCGDTFWQELAAEMTGHFKRSDFTQGIVHGVRKAGELLAQHFPCGPDDRNELPDAVEHD
jgi:uncharacterized membrane protein